MYVPPPPDPDAKPDPNAVALAPVEYIVPDKPEEKIFTTIGWVEDKSQCE